jgi:hypothetical protein
MEKMNIQRSIGNLKPDGVVVFSGDGYSLISVRNIASRLSSESRKKKMYSVSMSYEKDEIKVTRVK